MAFQHKNNGASKLAGSLTAGAVTLSVQTGEGSRFPLGGGADWFPLTILKADGTFEIVKCTSRTGDVFAIVRAQESTSALAFNAGDRVELRLTSAALDDFLQVSEVGTAAFADLTTSATDTTAGRVTKVGDFGWNGGNVIEVSSGSCNALVAPAVYNIVSAVTDKPGASFGYIVRVSKRANGTIFQEAFLNSVSVISPTEPLASYRSSLDGVTWTPWVVGWNTSNLVKTTSSTDTTAGSMLKVGDFGLGGVVGGNAAGSVDLNTILVNGWYYSANSAINSPSGAGSVGALFVISSGAGYKTQIYYEQVSPFREWHRTYYLNTTWSPWVEVATSANSFGQGQILQDLTGSRSAGTTYTNSTGRTIWVSVNNATGAASTLTVTAGGGSVVAARSSQSTGGLGWQLSAPVPNGGTYVYAGATISNWVELR